MNWLKKDAADSKFDKEIEKLRMTHFGMGKVYDALDEINDKINEITSEYAIGKSSMPTNIYTVWKKGHDELRKSWFTIEEAYTMMEEELAKMREEAKDK